MKNIQSSDDECHKGGDSVGKTYLENIQFKSEVEIGRASISEDGRLFNFHSERLPIVEVLKLFPELSNWSKHN